MVHAYCMLDTKGCMRALAHTRAPLHTPTHAHVRTHTEKYVIIIAFPRQQWLRERASVPRYTYIACLVYI